MLSKEPIDLGKAKKWNDKEALRLGMIAELDAINLYEQLAASVSDEKVRRTFLDIAKEEKAHVGEFETLLLEKDSEQVAELKQGRHEVESEE